VTRRVPWSRRVTRSEAETCAAGGEIAAALGNLGSGKTVLARGLSAALGVPPEEVRSPTFTLVNPYRGRCPVYHVDLYRIDKPSELDELGLEEILGGDGVAIVEWAERLGAWRPDDALVITIEDLGGTERALVVEDRRAGPAAGGNAPAEGGGYSTR
jgi:tRNA threonylcarbamoyladenosine biosynthesis protein TsaE